MGWEMCHLVEQERSCVFYFCTAGNSYRRRASPPAVCACTRRELILWVLPPRGFGFKAASDVVPAQVSCRGETERETHSKHFSAVRTSRAPVRRWPGCQQIPHEVALRSGAGAHTDKRRRETHTDLVRKRGSLVKDGPFMPMDSVGSAALRCVQSLIARVSCGTSSFTSVGGFLWCVEKKGSPESKRGTGKQRRQPRTLAGAPGAAAGVSGAESSA